MSKGTPSQGKKSRGKTHIMCRRCGNRSYHKKRKTCAHCGFGRTKKMNSYKWNSKTVQRIRKD